MKINPKELNLHDSILELVKTEENDLVAYFSHGTIEKEATLNMENISIRFHKITAQNFYTTNGGKNNFIPVIQSTNFFKNYNLVGENAYSEDENLRFKVLLFNNSSNYEFYDLTWEITCEKISVEIKATANPG